MNNGPVVIFGSRGQMGEELCRVLGDQAVGVARDTVDITDRDRVFDYLTTFGQAPAAVINAAAYTKVDLAENDSDTCHAVNSQAVGHLADTCQKLDCPLVQLSTDYVFGSDTNRLTPLGEDDLPGPVNVYGRSKLDGERQAAGWARHIIVRTCGLYSSQTKNDSPRSFVDTILRLGRERSVLRVVNDQCCTPSYVPHVARALLFLLQSQHYGLYHVVNRGATTWYAFAVELFRQCSMNVQVEPITSGEYPMQAQRPKYSVLDSGKYENLGSPSMPEWQQAIAECLVTRGEVGRLPG